MRNGGAPIEILLVEDDPSDARSVRVALAEAGFGADALLTVSRLDAALECLAVSEISWVLLDLGLPDSNGLETLLRVYAASPEVPIIVLTGAGDDRLAVEALRSGAQDYIVKSEMSAVLLKRSFRYARERAQIATTLRSSEEQLRAIIDHTRDVLVTIGPDGHIASLNRAFEVATGWPRETWLRRPFAPLVHPDDLARATEAFRRVSGREEAFRSQELRILCVDGHYLIAEFGWAICRVGGQPVTLLGVARDITERKRVDQECREARDDAESATRAKTEFLARMSHEIRTPMNGVLGMAELVLETELTGEQRSRLLTLQRSAQLLLRVIDEILDFSRLEAGKLALASARFRLRDTFDAIKLLQVRAEQKGLTFRYDMDPDVPEAIIGDGDRVYQVLVNLVGNSIKFTQEGGITIQVSTSVPNGDGHDGAPAGSSVELHFTVRDTGIGIAPEKHQAIFSPFEQADGSTFRQHGGTGLGLAISAQLVELMGGRLWVESALGEGSAFHFAVRFGVPPEEVVAVRERGGGPATAAVEPAVAAGPARRLRVLLAEDNIVNQEIATMVLQQRGHAVVLAATGVAAVAAFERETFDVILMDLQMPEMHGYEATAQIRRREAELPGGRRVPIVAMTANAMPRDRQKCREAGMDDFLSKPVKARALIAMVERQAEGVSAPEGPPPELSSPFAD